MYASEFPAATSSKLSNAPTFSPAAKYSVFIAPPEIASIRAHKRCADVPRPGKSRGHVDTTVNVFTPCAIAGEARAAPVPIRTACVKKKVGFSLLNVISVKKVNFHF
jgi:hypothetical protein